MIPRGTPAHLFRPIMVEGNSQLFKAFIGAIQLIFATFQLVSANNPRFAAYGYGSFIYTITPYAIGSFINFFGAIFTDSYSDITEMVLKHDINESEEMIYDPHEKKYSQQGWDDRADT